MLNILICDDDIYTRRMLEKVVSQNPFVDQIFMAEDGVQAVNITQEKSIDIALLDIDMPNLGGIDAANLMSKFSPKIKFMFITAHMEYAIESFSVHPYDYLLKPIDILKLKDTINNLIMIVLKESETIADKITIKSKQEIFIIPIKDILYLEKSGPNILVHTRSEAFTLDKTLSELENKLNNSFLRVHKSFIVNMDNVKIIKNVGNRSYQIEFFGTKKVASMSRYKFEELKGKMVTF